MSERGAQIMRHRIGKRFQLVVGGLQLRGTFHHPRLEFFVELADFPFGRSPLSNVTERGQPSTHYAVFIFHWNSVGLDQNTLCEVGIPYEQFVIDGFSMYGTRQRILVNCERCRKIVGEINSIVVRPSLWR